MHIVVIADGPTQNEFLDKPVPGGVQVQLVTSINEVHQQADAYFYLLDEESLAGNHDAIKALDQLVFVNAVHTTLQALPSNCVRINAWPGFMLGKAVELAASEQNLEKVNQVFKALEWSYHQVADIPGFITPRTIAMIVNEAYFALGEEVSTKADIDIAMKLGTGYPFGPFEWSEKIGLKRIVNLLNELAKSDKRYEPAPLLIKESGI
jgi:3-hydroxybutyryl-CoA dehydrogenase